MINHLYYYRKSQRRLRPPSSTESDESDQPIMDLVAITPYGSESSDSQRLISPDDDAREGYEQARIRPGSLNSDEGNQLILPQTVDEPEQPDDSGEFEAGQENEDDGD